MTDLPTGTVTFLFTDIAGSTRLLHELRDEYALVLADQRALLRAAFEKWNGVEIDTQGDSFFVVFSRAVEAIGASVEAQRSVAAHAWPRGATVRVRMGLHTGEPRLGPTGYVGIDVHRASRICSAAHGGQVLLSQTTCHLVESDLPPGVGLRDLGEYRLKDLARTERLFQLDIPDLVSDFPPPQSLNALPGADVIGMTIHDRYRLDHAIGRGGMGTVYQAHDLLLDRDVAVKVLSARAVESRARLQREARAVAKLNHPNIVSVYDAGESAGLPFIVMELVPGDSLHAHPPQTLDETLAIARQICAALDHAHAQGIVHRDLKPENVLLTKDGIAKLMDFGLARSSGGSHITQEGAIVGTVLYLAPEQARGQTVDGRSDLYSLGVMLYEFATGQLPFKGDDPIAIISQHLNAPVVPPSSLRSDIPPSFEAIIMKLLAKDPNDRFGSAHEVEEALTRISEGYKPSTASASRHNLPIRLSSFIGREREMAEIKRLLSAARLVSLTGAGGSGKTRLSIQVAADVVLDYADGVWLVELETLSDPLLLPQKIASSLGLRQEASRSLPEMLTAYLHERTLLFILDNCEHMIDAVAQWVDLMLRTCANLHVLTTSREALGIAGEATFHVPSLSLPDVRHLPPVEKLTDYDAVRLLVDRANNVSPGFRLTEQNALAVAQVCNRLDGIPLAIELAAARVNALSIEQIATRLDDRFRLLTGGSRTALPRQQTLRALIDWSYDLLTESERVMLRRLSVFAGGWTLEAAEAVCSCNYPEPLDEMDLLARLIDKSLVVADGRDDATRYRMLETIRQYGRDRLTSSGEAETLRACHIEYFLNLAESAAHKQEADPILRSDRLEAEYDNLRAALEWAWEMNRAETALRLTAALWRFWEMRSYFGDSRVWLERALKSITDAPAPMQAQILHGLGRLDRFQGKYAEGAAHLEACLALYRDLESKIEIADVLQILGEVAAEQGDLAEASRRFEEALTICLTLGDQPRLAGIYLSQGEVARVRGDYDSAARLYSQSLALLEALGDDRRRGIGLYNLGQVTLHQGDCPHAVKLFLESIRIGQKIANKWMIAHGLAALVGAACWSEQPERAVKLAGAGQALFDSIDANMDLADRIEYERSLASLRVQLDEKTFNAARAEGEAMTMEEAVAFALGEAGG